MLYLRHLRAPMGDDFDARAGKHRGVVTVAARIIGEEPKRIGKKLLAHSYRIVIGMAFCSPADSFCKKKGRTMALDRMNNDPLIVPYLHNWQIILNGIMVALAMGDIKRVRSFSDRDPSWLKHPMPGTISQPTWLRRWGRERKYKVIEGDQMAVRLVRRVSAPMGMEEAREILPRVLAGVLKHSGLNMKATMVGPDGKETDLSNLFRIVCGMSPTRNMEARRQNLNNTNFPNEVMMGP